MTRSLLTLTVLVCASCATAGSAPSSTGVPMHPPVTVKKPVTDLYHGVSVTEDYRWLEDWSDDAVQDWSEAQNSYARSLLDKLPGLAPIRQQITEIMEAQSVSWHSLEWRRNRLFAIKRQPPKEQPFLVVMDSADALDSERVLLDPMVLDPQGTTAIDFFVPSPDGSKVAVSLSKGGTESGDVHIYDVATGAQIGEPVPRVNGGTAGGGLAWLADGSGFFYTRYPRPGERAEEDMSFYQQLWFRRLGTPHEQDRYELGKEFPRIAQINLELHHPTGRLLATVQDGDSGRFELHLRDSLGAWTRLARHQDEVVQATFAPQGQLYLISRAGAPRGRILMLDKASPSLEDAKVVVAEGKDTVVSNFYGHPSMRVTPSRLYVTFQLGGPSTIRAYDLQGQPQARPELLPVSSVGGLCPLEGDEILYVNESFISPPSWYRFDSQATQKTALVTSSPVHFEDVEVLREFAPSKDGTQVPVNIIRRRDATRDGSGKCIVTGYGGYGLSIAPRFSAVRRVLLDRGVCYAVSNLRGGGEYGKSWHDQGRLTTKQNVFDDFAGVLEHLIARGYTSPDGLGIIGGSNGGLLMAATMVQHPQRVKAVVSFVGIYDALRMERSPNGAFNIPEFGTVKDKAQFEALHAYSPYHHVVDGTAYPAVLFLTGANDPRVDPMHSRKITARLQAAAPKSTTLLRTSSNSGHGGDTALSEYIEQHVDVYAFLLRQLGSTETVSTKP